MSARIFDIGSTTSPAHGSGTGSEWPPGVPPPARIPAVLAGVATPDSMKPTMSRFVTRPAIPVPCSESDVQSVLSGDFAHEGRRLCAHALFE